MSRRDELARGLAAVRARIERACAAAGRDPAEVTLVAVTKTFPASDVRLVAGLGVVDVGENRTQEAVGKAADLADLDLRWHFVGQLQTNKAAAVAGFAHLVHSVDRPRLVAALAAAADPARPLGCLVQVALDGDPARGGAAPDDVAALAARVAAEPALSLRGVMAIAPRDADPAAAFAHLAAVAAGVRREHPSATIVSAGMSGDLEAAIRAGATHVRVGTALLGGRGPLVR